MLGKLRGFVRIDEIRRSLREKAIRVVDDAVAPYHREQVERLEREISQLRNEVASQTGRVLDRVVEFEIRSRRDIVYAGDQEAALSSARFVREHMPTVPHFPHPHATLDHALSLAPTGGLALEFGVYTGTTLKIIAAGRGGSEVFGFDSFDGLPEDWRNGFPAGMFATDGPPDVPGAELVVGWFEDTLPKFLAEHPGPVDFLHVDGDLYSSAKTVIDQVVPRMRPGGVILFDEFFNFPGWQTHEYRAWLEFLARTDTPFEYAGYTYENEQVIVKIAEDATPPSGGLPRPAGGTAG